jgi:hypothetical protein
LKRVDLYVSTTRAYIFLERRPYACANLPSSFVAGPATVTFGDVAYHTEADDDVTVGPANYPLLANFMRRQTTRRFDNLGFQSGEGTPPWDETRFPCTSALAVIP